LMNRGSIFQSKLLIITLQDFFNHKILGFNSSVNAPYYTLQKVLNY
jgi:hypothetical protein